MLDKATEDNPDDHANNPLVPRTLDDILQYRRHTLFSDVLNPWIEKAQLALTDLDRFRTCSPFDRTDEPAQNAMWNLYALSRVNDLLLASFQTGAAESKIAPVSLDEYEAFFSRIGFAVVEAGKFSPFHHEIVQIHQSNAHEEPIGVLGRLWPFDDRLEEPCT
jgi:hypothetical protein